MYGFVTITLPMGSNGRAHTHKHTRAHTLAQKYLIELLMWNASNVHKQSSTVWQEKLVDPSWNSVRGMLSTSLLWRRFWCNRTQNKRPDCDNSAEIETVLNDMPVLGLAGRHWRKLEMQVRMADQAMYHQGNQSVFVGGRLWTLLPPPAKTW